MNETETIEVPHFEGYKCIGYASPKIGQYYLAMDSSKLEYVRIDFVTPFLVYEKIPPKRYVFEETGECRQANPGEYYLDSFGHLQRWNQSQWASVYCYKVLRQVEE